MKMNQKNNNTTLTPAAIRTAENHVFVMAASAPDFVYGPETYEDFATSIHNLVCRTRKFGKAAAEYQSQRLREVLTAKGIPVPDKGDFIYFGGRSFPVPDLFAEKADRKKMARNMARGIVDSIGTSDECSDAEVTEILAESSALDEDMLTMRTAALVSLLRKKRPDFDAIDEHIGNFTILPDGSLLSLHYLYTA